MTTYTRTLSAIAAAALVVATTVSTVAGQPPAGQRPGPGFGRGGPGGPFPVLGQLNLTDDQKAQVKTLLDEERAQTDAQSPGRKLMELQRALTAAVFADVPDAAQIDQLRASIAEAEAAALATRVDMQLKIAQILTPEQRQRARELTRSACRPGTSGGQARRERRGKRRRNTPVTIPDV